MRKAYKYRLYPRADQAKMIEQTMSACRLVYNLGLELKIWAYRNSIKLSIFDLERQIKDLRKEHDWIRDVSSNSLHRSLSNLGRAYEKFFNGGGFPKFKKKKSRCSILYNNNTRRVDFANGLLSVDKLSNIPIEISQRFEGNIKTITITKSATGKYFASVVVETNTAFPPKQEIEKSTTIGLDIGIKSFVVTSDGRSFRANQKMKVSLQRLKVLQKRASRKKKGSKNRKKANLRVALLHEKITNQRADYIHKITTGLIRDSQADTFVIEDLNVSGMLKNETLARPIQDASFGEFFRQMRYKCEWYGKNLINICLFTPSSKRCSECGQINSLLTLKDREWACECGACHDRDLNAAKNIKYYGLLKHSGEGIAGEPVESSAIAGAMKQENIPALPKR